MTTVMFLLSIILFFGLVLSIPSYLVSLTKEKEKQSQVEQKRAQTTTEQDETKVEILNKTKEAIILFKKEKDPVSMTNLINTVIEIADNLGGIDFNGLSYVLGDEKQKESKVLISGVSETRDKLLSFTNALRVSGMFKAVELPVSNLKENIDLSFSINATISLE
ncbi:hypothetical protein COW81_02830 [Candidatus Campbellbacteria bacterium CG22_combo_CG10-13_8_21_14_all_36_13]|uniref:Uncharacterized protein n=1 Tax=Candidatus Campbellbacteria bacterium CG22_combo_CG10-13_8_21_14_all_36_13 TaxID=1974529 RepID=A0A2H0DY71_9BACT|nr:MAG: hypothetical protein COW81_02830 [Candidatus Campbellbacteria bacterium CG22_combo_CG10-13_8_21_14_all_36_13]